jgi:hypothetical protein
MVGQQDGFVSIIDQDFAEGAPMGPSLEKQLASMSDRTRSILPPQGLPSGTRRFVHLDQRGAAAMTQLDKHAMVRDLGIRYRDSVMLDPSIPIPFPASLLVRESAIIVNLEAIRMIICANQVYILSCPKASQPPADRACWVPVPVNPAAMQAPPCLLPASAAQWRAPPSTP